jgi:hypothetical protein
MEPPQGSPNLFAPRDQAPHTQTKIQAPNAALRRYVYLRTTSLLLLISLLPLLIRSIPAQGTLSPYCI